MLYFCLEDLFSEALRCFLLLFPVCKRGENSLLTVFRWTITTDFFTQSILSAYACHPVRIAVQRTYSVSWCIFFLLPAGISVMLVSDLRNPLLLCFFISSHHTPKEHRFTEQVFLFNKTNIEKECRNSVDYALIQSVAELKSLF